MNKNPDTNVIKELKKLYLAKDYVQAKKRLVTLVKSYPDSSQLLSMLAVIFHNQGDFDEAIKYYEKSIKVDPKNSDTLNNFGSTLCKKHKFEDGLSYFEKALEQKSDHTLALENAGIAAMHIKKFQLAINYFSKLLTLDPGNVIATFKLASCYFTTDRMDVALKYCDQSLKLDPLMVEAAALKSKVSAKLVAAWHVPMMNDDLRNKFYYSALKSAINNQSSILEIGTGSGLLSIMAANLNPREVNTCETNTLIADCAEEVIKENNLQNKINVIKKNSKDIKIGHDMTRKADVLVSEILSSEFLGEGVFQSIEDAKKRLLTENAKLIPEYGNIMIALFGGDEIGKNVYAEKYQNIKFKKFNKIVQRKHFLSRQDLKIIYMSQPVEAFHFDFIKTKYFNKENKKIEIEVTNNGKCYGVIQWIKLGMQDGLKFENNPRIKNIAVGWQPVLYLFDEPIELKIGKKVSLICKHDRDKPWFFLDKIDD